jgi:hypothetical protein
MQKPHTTRGIVRNVRQLVEHDPPLRAERMTFCGVFDHEATPAATRIETAERLKSIFGCSMVELVPYSGNVILCR